MGERGQLMTEQPGNIFNDSAAEKGLLGIALSAAGRKVLNELELYATDLLDPRPEALWFPILVPVPKRSRPTPSPTTMNSAG